MTIEVKIDDWVFKDTEEERIYIENELLAGDGTLILHSNDIGDGIGIVKRVSNIRWIPEVPK